MSSQKLVPFQYKCEFHAFNLKNINAMFKNTTSPFMSTFFITVHTNIDYNILNCKGSTTNWLKKSYILSNALI